MPATAVRGAVARVLLVRESARSIEFIIIELAKISFDSSFQEVCLFLIGTDDEDGVISSDCAYNLRPVFVVDSGCDGLSASGCCYQHKEVHCLPHFKPKALEHLTYFR